MSKGLFKWVDSLVVLLVLGPVAYFAVSKLRAPDGDPYTTLLSSSTPGLGAGLACLILGLGMVAAVVSGRVFGRGRGVCMAGLIAGWAAWACGNVRQVLGDADAASVPMALLMELGLLGVLAATLVVVVELISSIPGEELGRPDLPAIAPPARDAYFKAVLSANAAMGAAAAAAACGLLVYLLAFSGVKGQSIFAAVIGGIGAGAAFGLVWASRTSAEGSRAIHTPLLPPVVAVVLVGVIGAVVAKMVPAADLPLLARAVGADGISGSVSNRHALLPLATVMPLDWLTGALLGVPVGCTWSTSMVDKSVHATAKA